MTAIQTQEFDFSLPEPPEIFIGRKKELEEILLALNEGKNIIIYGFEGVGKTSLAVKVAQIYNATRFKENKLTSNENKPYFIDLEHLIENEGNFLNVEETNQILDNASIILFNNPNSKSPFINGKYDFSEGIDQSKKFQEWLKKSFSDFVKKARVKSIPVIVITSTKLPILQRILKQNKFKDFELKEFSIDETKKFLAIKELDLNEEELKALFELTGYHPKNLEDVSHYLISLMSLVISFANIPHLYVQKPESLGTTLKTFNAEELAFLMQNSSFIELLLENPNDLFQILLESYLEDQKNKLVIKVILKSYLILGIENYKNKKYKKALSILLRVKHFSKTENLLEILAPTLLYLGHIFKTIGELYRSRLAYKDALRMFQQLKDEPNIAETSASLAALEILQGRTTDARKHLSQARQYFEIEGKPKAVKKMDDLFEAADYVDGAQMVQGRSDGVLV